MFLAAVHILAYEPDGQMLPLPCCCARHSLRANGKCFIVLAALIHVAIVVEAEE